MSAAVERLERAIADASRFALRDYDVDGTTAVVLLKTVSRCWAAWPVFMCRIGCTRYGCNRACSKPPMPKAFV